MEWVEPKYTKTQVSKAGRILVSLSPPPSDESLHKSITVLGNWRGSHAFPMRAIYNLLKKYSKQVDPASTTVQRLKRSVSIFNKLCNQEGMQLARMEDIAGCRAIVENTDDVYKLLSKFQKSSTKNILHRQRDYIKEILSDSGYRGIHIIYKYNGNTECYRGMFIEIQIRSKVQHSWATAVEVVGIFIDEDLKASLGNDAWLEFFKYVSVEFSKLENTPFPQSYHGVDTLQELKSYVKHLDIFKTLETFTLSIEHLGQKDIEDGYFVLTLDIKNTTISYRGFQKGEQSKAMEHYDELEIRYKDNNSLDFVLISASSINELKKGYTKYNHQVIFFLYLQIWKKKICLT